MKYSGFHRDEKRHFLQGNVLWMRSDVSKEMSRFRLPSSGRRRLLLKVPSCNQVVRSNSTLHLMQVFFLLIANTILTIQYQTPLTLITMFIYITFLTVTNNYTTYSIQLYNVLTTQSTDYTIT